MAKPAAKNPRETVGWRPPVLAWLLPNNAGMMRLRNWTPASIVRCRETVHFVTWRISSWQSALTEAERDGVTRVAQTLRGVHPGVAGSLVHLVLGGAR